MSEIVVTRPMCSEARSPGACSHGQTRALPPPTLAMPKREVMQKKGGVRVPVEQGGLVSDFVSIMVVDKTCDAPTLGSNH
ncbi:hypothetical protein VNO80_16297 [Phaseolus coccineus]|uniref:Uncharacterized protein n=1 Tax=Phaseolus coccineus TaxID=3886 RepID=A0AAN9MM30_PHACN